MKFYGRKKELSVIQEELKLVGEQRSARMIVVTGRRRIGKTRLIEQSLKNSPIPTVQFIFYPYAMESVLVKEFLSEIGKKLGLNYLPACTTVVDVLAFLFDVAKTKPINIVIDECQEIDHVDPAFWGKLQALWDRNKRQCSVALFLCGSVASAMKHIFEDYSQPLFGRVDRIIQLAPFAPDEIKEILTDFNPQYAPDDLLALYVMTGGVAQYIEYLLERSAFHLKEMVEVAVNPTSFFLNEGNIMLANEFRAEYGIYYLILFSVDAVIFTLHCIIAQWMKIISTICSARQICVIKREDTVFLHPWCADPKTKSRLRVCVQSAFLVCRKTGSVKNFSHFGLQILA